MMKIVRPRKLLVPVKKRIADFAHLLGAEIFADWTARSLSSIGSDDTYAPGNVVATQIVSALSLGRIRSVAAIDYSSMIEAGVDDSARAWPLGNYFITPMYWTSYKDKYVDWNNSKIVVGAASVGYFDEQKDGSNLFRSLASMKRFELSRENLFSNCSLYIDDVYHALSTLNPFPQIPTAKELERYAIFRKKLLLELTIVAWRYLAFQGSNDYMGCHSRIVNVMRDYLADANIYEGNSRGISERTLTNLATKVIDQLKRRNNLEGALLNASPSAPPKKLIADDQ